MSQSIRHFPRLSPPGPSRLSFWGLLLEVDWRLSIDHRPSSFARLDSRGGSPYMPRAAVSTCAFRGSLICPDRIRSAIVFVAVFGDFTAIDRWTKKQVHCVYQALIVAIATRHADAVDIKFLVDGKTVWVALPHPAWVEYKKRTGKAITDSLAVEIAGHYLQSALQAGEGLGREMYSLTIEETLAHLEAAVSAMQEAVTA